MCEEANKKDFAVPLEYWPVHPEVELIQRMRLWGHLDKKFKAAPAAQRALLEQNGPQNGSFLEPQDDLDGSASGDGDDNLDFFENDPS